MASRTKERAAVTPAGATGSIPPVVDLTPVWDELAEHVLDGPSVGGDSLDAFGSRGGRYPELSPESQSLLAQGYQRGRAIRRAAEAGEDAGSPAEVQRALSQGEWCSEYLLGSVFRLVRSKVWERARGRFKDQWASELLPELLADATATVLEAAETFDPNRGPTFASWVSERLDHDLPGHMGKHGRPGSMPQAWARLARIAHHVKPELEAALGRTPSVEEVRVVLEERCRTWGEDHLSADQRELAGEEREKAITDKLRKQGMLKALTEVSEILAAMETHRSLDATFADGSPTGLVDTLVGDDSPEEAAMAEVEEGEYAQVLSLGTGNLDGRRREMVLTYLGLGDEEGGTYRKVAQQFGVPDLEVRHLVRDTQARMRAPHAQYAHLSGDLTEQFDEASDEIQPARAALVRRGRRRPEVVDREALLRAALA